MADPNTVQESVVEEDENSVESDSFVHVDNEEPEEAKEEDQADDQANESDLPQAVAVDDNDDQGEEP